MPTAAFATSTDLASALKQTFDAPTIAWTTTLLVQAAGIMRGIMRNQVYPRTQSTYIAYPTGGRVDLPQSHVRSVDAVTQNGLGVTYKLRKGALWVPCDLDTTVTFTFGLDTPPDDLVGINCALVSGPMMTVLAGLGLTAGGLSSVALDDFKAAWADGGASSGMVPSPFTEKYLHDTYGTTAWIVQGR